MVETLLPFLGEAAACIDGRWRPRFADPDAARWALTLGYLLAAGLAAMAAGRAPTGEGGLRAVLRVVAVLLLWLGLNKQLDLQTLVRAIGHCESRRAGWHAARDSVRVPVAITVIVAMALGAAWFAVVRRRAVARLADIGLGVTILLGYLAVRIGVWNRVGDLGEAAPVIGALMPFAEPAGLALVGLGAAVRLLRWRLSGPAPRPPG